jgi:hypothetical protein
MYFSIMYSILNSVVVFPLYQMFPKFCVWKPNVSCASEFGIKAWETSYCTSYLLHHIRVEFWVSSTYTKCIQKLRAMYLFFIVQKVNKNNRALIFSVII